MPYDTTWIFRLQGEKNKSLNKKKINCTRNHVFRICHSLCNLNSFNSHFLENPTGWFKLASKVTVGLVGLVAKILIGSNQNIGQCQARESGEISLLHFSLSVAFKRVLQFSFSSRSSLLGDSFDTKINALVLLTDCNRVITKFLMIFEIFLPFLVCLNNSKIFNVNRLESLVESRPKGVPLLTVGSHWSCFDDPAIWGCFKLKNVCSATKIRWSMAAHDICFNNALHSYVFGTGKCIPTIRGAGVYQPAVDLCIKKLRQGEWVHIFPEGEN